MNKRKLKAMQRAVDYKERELEYLKDMSQYEHEGASLEAYLKKIQQKQNNRKIITHITCLFLAMLLGASIHLAILINNQ